MNQRRTGVATGETLDPLAETTRVMVVVHHGYSDSGKGPSLMSFFVVCSVKESSFYGLFRIEDTIYNRPSPSLTRADERDG